MCISADSDTDMSVTHDENKEPENKDPECKETETKEPANNGEVTRKDPIETDWKYLRHRVIMNLFYHL